MTRILIVEDEIILARYMQIALENLEHKVVGSAASGAQAIQLASETKPELVLIDIQLEGNMDGVEVAEEIYNRFSIPVVYLTAHADDHTLKRATTTNPFGYLIKPFQVLELHTTIQIALRRYHIEQNLKATQQWFATTLASIGNAVIVTDSSGIITFMNPVAEALTGWQQQRALGEDVNRVLQLVAQQTGEVVENSGMHSIRLGTSVSLLDDCLLRSQDGQEKPVEGTIAPIKNNQGEVTGSVVVFQDISERQQAKVELQQQNQHLEEYQLSLVTQLHDQSTQLQQMSACIQLLKRITDRANHSLDERQIWQMTIAELGRILEADYCWVALHDEEYTTGTIVCEYISSGAENRPSAIGTQIYLQNSLDFYLRLFQNECWLSPPRELLPAAYQAFLTNTSQLFVCPIYYERQVIGEVGILTSDQPPSSLYQIELICGAISQSTVAIHQARLEQAAQNHAGEQEMINNLKYDFISSVSHELRTPLANMKMALEMVIHVIRIIKNADIDKASQVKQLLWPKLDQYIQILQEEWQQEFRLIKDLLTFQSEETPTELTSFSILDFQEWLPRIVKRFQVQAARLGQMLIYDIFPQRPIVFPDLPSLERIVTELLSNACKFTPPNKRITIVIQIEGNQLVIKVANTGIEIPAEELDRIFQPFYKVSTPNAWNYSGTGLGLALIKKLTLRLGGEIQVDSQNKRTEFIVILPLTR